MMCNYAIVTISLQYLQTIVSGGYTFAIDNANMTLNGNIVASVVEIIPGAF
jgi:hypothetical protein